MYYSRGLAAGRNSTAARRERDWPEQCRIRGTRLRRTCSRQTESTQLTRLLAAEATQMLHEERRCELETRVREARAGASCGRRAAPQTTDPARAEPLARKCVASHVPYT
eukprot:6193993-Pleurochrysis_carterae.AAC.1